MKSSEAGPCPIPVSMPVGGLTWGQLQEGLRAVIRAERQVERDTESAGVERLSLNRAAKLARTRPETVQAAATNGALQALKSGRRWSIIGSDLERWIRAGRPTTGGSHE